MNKIWVQGWLDLFANVDEMMKLYQPDVRFKDATLGISHDSVDGVRQFFSAFSAPGAGRHWFVADRYVGNRDAGALDWTWFAEFESEFIGYPAAGTHLEIPGVTLFTFTDEKIQTQLDLWDSGVVYRQLGVAKPFE